jgi:hypothetical protein
MYVMLFPAVQIPEEYLHLRVSGGDINVLSPGTLRVYYRTAPGGCGSFPYGHGYRRYHNKSIPVKIRTFII